MCTHSAKFKYRPVVVKLYDYTLNESSPITRIFSILADKNRSYIGLFMEHLGYITAKHAIKR